MDGEARPTFRFESLLDADASFVLVMRAGRVIFEQVDAAVAAEGESLVIFRVLAIVVRFGPQTQQDIATLTAQHAAGVSRIVDELEARELVRRVRGEHDRRTVRVEPTDTGRALFAKINPVAMRAFERAVAPVAEHDRVAFFRALSRIVEANGSSTG